MYDALKRIARCARRAVVSDPFNLQRFLSAQESVFTRVRAELAAGCKESHWMWFIFPQLLGLGSSPTARRYAIASSEEARAYLAHPILGPRLIACAEALLNVNGSSAHEIFA